MLTARPYGFWALFVIILLSIVSPSFTFTHAQFSIAEELAGTNETFSVKDTINSNRGSFQIIQFSDGDLILLDSRGSLVTDSTLLQEIFGIEGYKEAFLSYGISQDRYSALSSALADYVNALGFLRNPVIASIISLLVSFMVEFPVPANVVSQAGDLLIGGAEESLALSQQIEDEFSNLRTSQASTASYQKITALSDKLRTTLQDWRARFGYNLWGNFGSMLIQIGEAGISNPIPNIQDTARQIKQWGQVMVSSERTFMLALDWLDTWDASKVDSLANSNAQRMIQSQNSRLAARSNEYQAELRAVKDFQGDAQAYLADLATQGVDISIASSMLSQASVKLESAEIHASNYKFKSAISSVNEAEAQITKAIKVGQASLAIHQAELKINEAEKAATAKAAQGANINEAQSTLASAKTALGNAKATLGTDPGLAQQQAEQAFQLAETAYTLALQVQPPASKEAETTPAATPPSGEQRLITVQAIDPVFFILMGLVAAVVVGVAIYASRSRKVVQKAVVTTGHVEKELAKEIIALEKFCINCGRKILHKAKYCPHCGAQQER